MTTPKPASDDEKALLTAIEHQSLGEENFARIDFINGWRRGIAHEREKSRELSLAIEKFIQETRLIEVDRTILISALARYKGTT